MTLRFLPWLLVLLNLAAGKENGHQHLHVILGTESLLNSHRVEELQLRKSALHLGYNLKFYDSSVTCIDIKKEINKEESSDVILYLEKPYGIFQLPPEDTLHELSSMKAPIVIPDQPITALIGYWKDVQRASLAAEASSLSHLVKVLRDKTIIRSKLNVKLDFNQRIFKFLDNLSNIGDHGLNITEKHGRQLLVQDGHAAPIVLADAGSSFSKSLLLALSDYMIGDDYMETKEQQDIEERVMVGLFIWKPQPFLSEALSGIGTQIIPSQNKYFFFIYNQVPQYASEVSSFAEKVRKAGNHDEELDNSVLIQSTGAIRTIGAIKNMALQECLRIRCSKYIHIDANIFVTNFAFKTLLQLHPPLVTIALNAQQGMNTNVWRAIDNLNGLPAFSWDHKRIFDEKTKRLWHASCITTIYKLDASIVERIASMSPYTHPYFPEDPDMSFCASLQEEGIPMEFTHNEKDFGLLLNTTGHLASKANILTYESNPLAWKIIYISPLFSEIAAQRNFSSIERPCHEVYDFPAFTEKLCDDLVKHAEAVNKWSPALEEDMRKISGKEAVPTVDQWLTQLGLDITFLKVFKETIDIYTQIAYPNMGPQDIRLSLVARFSPTEQTGIPLHHDAFAITAIVNLTPLTSYKGGAIEFPRQTKLSERRIKTVSKQSDIVPQNKNEESCKVTIQQGHIIFTPGRLTHPKIMHNVTEGKLYRLFVYMDSGSIPDNDNYEE